jgi:tetratricopeptide (TPR) repeat protein
MGAAGDAGVGTVGEPAAAEALEGDFEPDGSFEFPARSESASVATGEAEPGASWEIPADGPEIAEALGQARRDLDAGLFEQAIGTASRLLAMNPDSRDAADMLDQARAAQEHHVRQLEELLDEAHRHVDHERLEEAEETLRQLLALSPGHAEAKELLERVARERHRAEATVNVVVQPPEPQATPEPEGVSLQRTHSARSSSEPEAGLAFDKPMRAEPVGGPGPLAARARRSLPKLSPRAALAAAAAIVILGGGWYAWNSFSGGPPAPAKAEPAPVRRARNPEAKAPAPSPARQVQPELKGDPKDLLREGRAAWQAGRTEDAVRYLRAAVTAAPEDASARSLLVEASARLEQEQKRQKDLAEAKTAFAGTRYSDALRIWYRLPESEQKGDLLLAMRNAWFNMAVEDLQIGDCRDASNHFGEVLQIKPADKEAQEGKKMAEGYMDRPKDVAYVSFANSLVHRAIDAD